MADKHICVAIYVTPDQADEAFSRLQSEGFSMDILSFVGRDYWKNMMNSRNAGERFLYRGNLGPFWERLWSHLRGWGVFWFFENGPVLVAGPLVRTIVATQEEGNANQQTSCFKAGLSGIGIPEESLVQYEKALMKNQILVFIQGTLNEINNAENILNETRAINHTMHHGTMD
ncbi:permease [Candidatus Sumerlaeota bacterium]|nr:permease [Candidatus Sumerlaeota bacterium]